MAPPLPPPGQVATTTASTAASTTAAATTVRRRALSGPNPTSPVRPGPVSGGPLAGGPVSGDAAWPGPALLDRALEDRALSTDRTLRSPTGGSTALLCRIALRHLSPGRHGVVDPGEPVAIVGEAGHAAQRAFPGGRVVPQRLALGHPPGHPDGQLVADAHRLLAGRGFPHGLHHGEHPGRDLLVRLAPGRPERVDQVRPGRRTAQRPVAHAEPHALEVVPRLDQPVVRHDLEPEPLRHRARGF